MRGSRSIRDYRPSLMRAIGAARAAGLGPEADRLERVASAAFTTSSELLAEQGEAILRFLGATRGRLPVEVKMDLDACLAEIGKIWPPHRRLTVWVYRRFFLQSGGESRS